MKGVQSTDKPAFTLRGELALLGQVSEGLRTPLCGLWIGLDRKDLFWII